MEICQSVFPKTRPPKCVVDVIDAFKRYQDTLKISENIGPEEQEKKPNITSDEVLAELLPDLVSAGYLVETKGEGDKGATRIIWPFSEEVKAKSEVKYFFDAWHARGKVCVEIEASRAIGGNAIYKHIAKSLLIRELKHLIVAVPIVYYHGDQPTHPYRSAVKLAKTFYSQEHINMPFTLWLIGYGKGIRECGR